ncbi:MAG: LysE family transporter [Gammaproteobacteria bacterium]|nr:LysE family transporter [Gammaproteobacteria bacterium]
MASFLLGLIIGIITSAPIGPVGLLTIQRTLTQGRMAGILSGAGAATADAFYGGLAGLGLGVVSGFLARQEFWIHLGAGVVCLWFGVRGMRFQPVKAAAANRYSGRGLLWNYLSMVLLTLANPLTILFFIVVFTTLHLDRNSLTGLLFTMTGLFTGCFLWWTALTLTTAHLHTQLRSRTLVLINRISALTIIGVGLAAIASAAQLAALRR